MKGAKCPGGLDSIPTWRRNVYLWPVWLQPTWAEGLWEKNKTGERWDWDWRANTQRCVSRAWTPGSCSHVHTRCSNKNQHLRTAKSGHQPLWTAWCRKQWHPGLWKVKYSQTIFIQIEQLALGTEVSVFVLLFRVWHGRLVHQHIMEFHRVGF